MVINSQKGFTLVEVLMAVLILAGAIGGALLLCVTSMASSELAWDTTVATSHAEHILEEMQARDSVHEIVSKNWEGWVEEQGLTSLPDEKIDVAFNDLKNTPVGIGVTVHWKRKSREHQITLNTELAK